MRELSQTPPALELGDPCAARRLLPWALRELRRAAFAAALALAVASGGRAEEKPAAGGEVKTLHGTLITMISEDTGHAMEIWAKGDNVRAELTGGTHKIINIQRGPTLYTFGTDSKQGMKQRFTAGLATMGLIEQIATIKSKGKKEESRTIDGVTYDQYSYDDPPNEWANVWFVAKTSAPSIWISAVKTGDKKATAVKMRYRDMEVNVEVSDELFKLPSDVVFSPVTEGEKSKERSALPRNSKSEVRNPK